MDKEEETYYKEKALQRLARLKNWRMFFGIFFIASVIGATDFFTDYTGNLGYLAIIINFVFLIHIQKQIRELKTNRMIVDLLDEIYKRKYPNKNK